MTMHFSHRSGGPCWTRELGYHTPKSLPSHIMRIITTPDKTKNGNLRMSTELPNIGRRVLTIDSSGLERHVVILGYDAHGEMAWVRYPDYILPNDWIPVGWLR